MNLQELLQTAYNAGRSGEYSFPEWLAKNTEQINQQFIGHEDPSNSQLPEFCPDCHGHDPHEVGYCCCEWARKNFTYYKK